MAGVSGFSAVDQTDDPDEYMRRLDQRAKEDFWQYIKWQMLAFLNIGPGAQVIDIGCGTGGDACGIARLVRPQGRVVGIDSSKAMICEAIKRSNGSGLPIEFCMADAHRLSFLDQSFDCCRVERVLQHLECPERALAEIVRVAKSGARIAIAEPDYGAVTIKGAGPEITRRLIRFRRAHFRSGRIGMLLPILCKRLGLETVSFILLKSFVSTVTSDEERILRRRYTVPAISAGIVSEQDGEQWLEDLKRASQSGTYFHALPVFLLRGTICH